MYEHKVGQLVALNKRLNYFEKKKSQYQAIAQQKRERLAALKQEYGVLKQLYEEGTVMEG